MPDGGAEDQVRYTRRFVELDAMLYLEISAAWNVGELLLLGRGEEIAWWCMLVMGWMDGSGLGRELVDGGNGRDRSAVTEHMKHEGDRM